MTEVLNIVPDDKFIDNLIRLCDWGCPNFKCTYILISDELNKRFKYIKNADRVNVVSSKDFVNFICSQRYDAVVLHGLYSMPLSLIPLIPKTKKLFWIAWGYDIYQNPATCPSIKLSLYRSKTKRLIDQRGRVKRFVSDLRAYISIKLNRSEGYNLYKKAVERVDYFSGILPEEYTLMNRLSYFNAKSFYFKYGLPKKNDLSELRDYKGNNILIGNSANPTNNHIDIFYKFKFMGIDNRKIIVPLNYGGNADYVSTVVNEGLRFFGGNFCPLLSFMEYKDYEEIIGGCSVGIFYIERQQSLGNITMMLLQGCKVFLSETSVIYRYYTNRGIKVFSIQRDLCQSCIDTPMEKNDIENNRKIILDGVGESTYRKLLGDFCRLITG